jgi:hypothetical protein
VAERGERRGLHRSNGQRPSRRRSSRPARWRWCRSVRGSTPV